MNKLIVFIIINLTFLTSASAEINCSSLATADEYFKCQLNKVDKRLNSEYKQIIKSSTPENKKLFREAQREWIKYRDKNCTSIAALKKELNYPAKHIQAQCLVSMTQAKASQLQSMSKPLPILWRKIVTGQEWVIWSEDGKGESVYPRKQKIQHEVTEHYLENVIALHSDLSWRIKEEKEVFTATPSISFIGKWYNYNVYDVVVDDESVQLKQIILETAPNTFKILYSLFPETGKVNLTPSYIINTGKEPVLVSKINIPASGNPFYEKYFVIDPDNGLPDTLDMSLITSTLKELLPAKHGIWKGGAFNLENLSYISPIWKDEDGNCCPTGGRVEIKFSINNGKLIPVFKKYDPNYNNIK